MTPAPGGAFSVSTTVTIVPTCVRTVGTQPLIDIALRHYRLFWVAWLDAHMLHVPVHARDTGAFANLHLDKASIAPSRAPWILHNPVLSAIIRCFVSYKYHTVIDASRAVVSGSKDTARVPAPTIVISRHSDRKRTIMELVLNSPYIVGITSVVNPVVICGSWGNFLVRLVSAVTGLGFVWVVREKLGTDFLRHHPVVVHPAAPATVGSRVAVDTFLFRESCNWIASHDRLHSLLYSRRCKGPAWAATTLVLHRPSVGASSPVDRRLEFAAFAVAIAVALAIAVAVALVFFGELFAFRQLGTHH